MSHRIPQTLSPWRGLLLLTATAVATMCPRASSSELDVADSMSPPPAYPFWDGQESVEQYAKRADLPPTKTLDLGQGVRMELVLIPAGQFLMGTPKPKVPKKTVEAGQTILVLGGAFALGLLTVILFRALQKRQRPKFSLRWLLLFVFTLSGSLYGGVRWWKTAEAWREHQGAQARYVFSSPDERPEHLVTLTAPFYLSKYEVTQEQYQAIAGANPSHFKSRDNPVESVDWEEVQDFFKKLVQQTKQTVRLPTEAEWEFSCRAGTRTMFYSGDTDKDLDRVAWYDGNAKNTTHPVGQKEPNPFGLYDMHGNVSEWCQDWYGDDYYSKCPAENPQAAEQGAYRVLREDGEQVHYRVKRGGYWGFYPGGCRSAFRSYGLFGGNTEGIRVVVATASRTPF